MNSQYDLIIVGGGMVGTALACALGNSPYRIALIEAGLPPSAPQQTVANVQDVDVRVSALNIASQAFLEQLGVWPLMAAERMQPYQQMKVWDGEGTGTIQFTADEMLEPYLGHIVENRVTTAALFQRVQQFNNVTLYVAQSVTGMTRAQSSAGEQWQVNLNSGEQVQGALVVAADGAMSQVRTLVGFPVREWAYGHHALVCTVQVEAGHQNTCWQRFMPSGPLAFLPVPNSQMCSIVWSCPQDMAEQLLALPDVLFCQRLGAALEHQLGEISAVGPRSAIPLRQRHATAYQQDSVVLVGDAAHTIHPLAGQGVNLGLMDAECLARVLLENAAKALPANNPLALRRYARERMPQNLTMMAGMEGFKRLFASDVMPLRWLRNAGMTHVAGLGFLKQHIMQEAMGLKRAALLRMGKQ
jgi:2-polyprenylphenol 6-hydroxylase